MFCYQCEQTAKGQGCDKVGVCGKQPDVAALHNLLTYALKGVSLVAIEGRKVGITDTDVNHFTCEAMFSTLTNVDFDPERIVAMINKCIELREGLKVKIKEANGKVDFGEGPATFIPKGSRQDLITLGDKFGFSHDPGKNPDIESLKHTLIFGLRGVCAYTNHAFILGQEDESVYKFIHEGLAATTREDLSINDFVGLVLKCGEINLRAMELLDEGNTSTYGHPVPTNVPLGTKKGKAILVSGHDLRDLEEILKQSEGKNIYVYTHGEMLPTHAYPGLKRYSHFYGHFGTAWQNQHKEFPQFPGPIIMTTNCIQKPLDSYKENIFTTGVVGWPDVKHIADKDYTPVIQKALEMPGYNNDISGSEVTVGFARNTVLGVADKVIEAVKSKHIRHFFLVAGCDGSKPGRNYYTEFVEKVPRDCVVLTLACGKFRFFDKDMGDIDGIPRLLDIGQCNDAYSAIQITIALANAFGVGVNDLPLSMVLSWYEQKAVAILLTLLHLGIKDIRLGPTLPAFITPNVLDVLVKNFNIMPISTPDEDLRAILG
ncbi:hydroxylamine reductase [Chloroflexota bacterium]